MLAASTRSSAAVLSHQALCDLNGSLYFPFRLRLQYFKTDQNLLLCCTPGAVSWCVGVGLCPLFLIKQKQIFKSTNLFNLHKANRVSITKDNTLMIDIIARLVRNNHVWREGGLALGRKH